MSKGKWVIGGLIFVMILLCMMSIYLQRQYVNMRIAYNRADREYIMLQADYQLLYDSYYLYEKKVVAILNSSKNVYWASDSSAYMLLNDSNFIFSFYKKPRMDNDPILWLSDSPTVDENHTGKYQNLGKIQPLKSHQFFKGKLEGWEQAIIVAPALSTKSGTYPSSAVTSVISF